MRKRGKYARVGWNTGRRRCKPSTSVGRVGHGSGSKPRFPRYGSSGCWPSAGTNCGWGMRPRSGRRRCGSRRRIPPCGTEHLLDLLLTNRFPRIWVPPVAERDLRQLLVHRMKLVRVRTLVKNQLHALAMSQGVCRKRKLWSVRGRAELQSLALLPWASRRRHELLAWLDQLEAAIAPLDRAVAEEAEARAEARLLMTHPGVGPVVSLAFVLTVGRVERFAHSGKLVSYLGLNPREHSSGGRQRLGAISKQGNSMLRWLLVEAAQTAAWRDEELHRAYLRLKFRRASGVAKVAIARRLAVRLYWMLRERKDYAQLVRMSGSPSSAVVPQEAGSKV